VRALVPAGNIYVNRTINRRPWSGFSRSAAKTCPAPAQGGRALVSQPPCRERAVSVNIAAQGGDPALLDL